MRCSANPAFSFARMRFSASAMAASRLEVGSVLRAPSTTVSPSTSTVHWEDGPLRYSRRVTCVFVAFHGVPSRKPSAR
ncbi:hypothetical protein COSO111634_15985 [Corallococcus soli]